MGPNRAHRIRTVAIAFLIAPVDEVEILSWGVAKAASSEARVGQVGSLKLFGKKLAHVRDVVILGRQQEKHWSKNKFKE